MRRAIKRSAGRLVPLDTRLTVGEPASRRAFSCFAWCRLRGDAEMAARQVPAGLLAVIAIATLCGLILLAFSPAWYANLAGENRPIFTENRR